MADITTVYNALRACLEGASGAGLTAGTVVYGRPPHGGRVKAPAAYLALAQLDSEVGPDLCSFTRTAIWDITIYTTGGGKPETRALTSFAMLDAVMASIEADRSLGGACRDVYMIGTHLDGDDLAMTSAPVIMLQVATRQVLLSGEGV